MTGERTELLRVRLFGSEPQFFARGHAAASAAPKRALALLAYLALHADRASSRDAIAAALWPDVSDDEARANLRRHLSLLKGLLPEGFAEPWIASGRTLQWNGESSATVDVIEFERQARSPQTRAAAIELYSGDIFESLEDEWIAPLRERYREKFLSLLCDEIDARERAGDIPAFLQHGRTLVRFDPLREDVVRRLMLARAESGDGAGALQEFKDFEKRLAGEMAAEPMAETIACFESIKRGDVAPALQNAPSPKTNLPRQLTSFVGRESEISEIAALIARHQLVTLVGSAGVGKTRTSIHAVESLIGDYLDGVWFIELAPLASPDYLTSRVAQTLGVTLPHEGNTVENLARALVPKQALLVFDNCEHMVEAVAHLIATILRVAPNVKVLASSRQGLGLTGEATYRMPSLADPSAVALFVERAQASDNRFVLSDENAPTVAEICRRLDGIPLAIELAASRVKLLSPRQLRERLDRRFAVLTGGSRDALPRQQTLRATIDWSHDLLDERERALFRRLGIFVNGFTLEGAVATASGEDLSESEVFELLASLVDKSLVLTESDGDAQRYRLLESTRAYALEKLKDGAEHDRLAKRHLLYLRDRFAAARAQMERTARLTEYYAAFAMEVEDIRAALNGEAAQADLPSCVSLFCDVGPALQVFGFVSEGMIRNESLLAALPADEPLLEARLADTLAHLRLEGNLKLAAFASAERALEAARLTADLPMLGAALQQYASTGARVGKLDEAVRALEEAEALPNASARLRNRLRYTRGVCESFADNLEVAARLFEQQATEERSLGNARAEQNTLLLLAEIEHGRGRTDRAITLAREAISGTRARADHLMLANLLSNLAGYLLALDDPAGADGAAREAVRLVAHESDHVFVATSLEHLALVSALNGDWGRAAMLAGYADAAVERLGSPREYNERTTFYRLRELLEHALGPDELTRLIAAGAALTPEAAIAFALA